MNKQEEIKKDNKKAILPFLLIILASTLAGGVLGFFSSHIKDHVKDLGPIGDTRILKSSAWGLLLVTVVSIALSLYYYRKARSLQKEFDMDEDEDALESVFIKINKYLDLCISISSNAMLLGFLFFGLQLNGLDFNDQLFTTALSLAAFIALAVSTILFQQKTVDLYRTIAPEKKGSVYDFSFSEKWEDSCDEAETLTLYRCGYKTFKAMNRIYIIAILVCLFGNFLFRWDIIAFIAVCILCLVQNIHYCYTSYHLENKQH